MPGLTRIVTADQMRLIEDRSEAAGVSKDALMEMAGLEVAKRIRHFMSPLYGKSVLVLVGSGNNGGDGLVVARHMQKWGARVQVYICGKRPTPDPKLTLVHDLGIPVISESDDDGLKALSELLACSHVVVDSVLGTGRARPIESPLKEILESVTMAKAASLGMLVLALDLPTGVDADTGAADPGSLVADVTVSLGYPKVGHFGYEAAQQVGRLDVVDIGIPTGLDEDVRLYLLTNDWLARQLPERPNASHKGSFGRAMVVAGSPNYIGAAYLAGTAATRVGAGLVTIALPQSIQMAVASKATEPTYLPLPEQATGVYSEEASRVLLGGLDGYEAMLIGCGMGQAETTRSLIEGVLCSGQDLQPTVVDADGLNTLAQIPNWWERFKSVAVLTPHPGEMARLTGKTTSEVQADRISIATESAQLWNKIVVLKGAYTVVAFPDGGAMLSPFANAGLASAGTGDVLAGSIVGLLSQGLSMQDAAAVGVYLHGLAGEEVRRHFGDTGMVASDLLPELPLAIKSLRLA
ncbi:MAG: NAD(P)H-hydrate dehydratase [Chloroflexi bacterium]|nr:NAD(P)H-hydrate dehydratase [Chloroflexota bacterium]MDA1228584.1 NAD(P)H-hydrate dehydratase [Chloroflexota bacterium]